MSLLVSISVIHVVDNIVIVKRKKRRGGEGGRSEIDKEEEGWEDGKEEEIQEVKEPIMHEDEMRRKDSEYEGTIGDVSR